MQSLEEAAHIAYQNELDAAERYLTEHPEGGLCCNCSYAKPCTCSEHLEETRYQLSRMVSDLLICTESTDNPLIVDRNEYHTWDECFIPAPVG